jgi:hypothetical protein
MMRHARRQEPEPGEVRGTPTLFIDGAVHRGAHTRQMSWRNSSSALVTTPSGWAA